MHLPTQGSDQLAPGSRRKQWPPPSELSKYTLIAVMGVTGSGKTTFVNQASGSHLQVGGDLESCTSDIQLSNEFVLGGRRVLLIDTPGFDDSRMSDFDVWKMIVAFLGESYSAGVKLAGIIYAHRISDEKFGGLAAKNFRMFRELCGEKTLKNVVLMTNMWGRATPEQEAAREQQLKDKYFKAAIEKGAQMCRHSNTPESAREVLRKILRNRPAALKIQSELVEQHMDVGQTGLGVELNKEICELVERYRREVRELEETMRKAMDDKEEAYRRELREEKRKAQEEIKKLQRESAWMRMTMEDLRRELRNAWRCIIM